jgi:hypothetical protein
VGGNPRGRGILMIRVLAGDCREVLATLPADSVACDASDDELGPSARPVALDRISEAIAIPAGK